MKWQIIGGLAIVLAAPTARADEPKNASPAAAEAQAREEKGASSTRSIAEKFAAIRTEYDNLLAAHQRAVEAAKSRREASELAEAFDWVTKATEFSRRTVDLALASPADPASRDALIWVISHGGKMSDEGAYGGEFARASALLVRHHGDDPAAVHIGLGASNVLNFHREALVRGFYTSAKERAAKGLARLALARYLERKAQFAATARKRDGRPKARSRIMDDDGQLVTQERDISDEQYAYVLHLRECDSTAIRAEAERLYEEVMAEYADVEVPKSAQERRLASLLTASAPQLNGKPLTDEARRRIEQNLARKQTLGELAEASLDRMLNLAVGKLAPEIEGVDIEGKPLKLSEYRGKVVVIVFWGSWCGPCMAQLPGERKLVERLKSEPFALLGVECNDERTVARETLQREKMTWPNWYDGAGDSGPIAERYHIRGFPRIFVLDAKGVIRARQVSSDTLDPVVDQLLKEMKQATP